MNERPPPLVAHIIFALGTGGLENGLVNIINRASAERYRHAIICLTTADDFASRITAPGVEVITLNKKPGHDWRLFLNMWRLLRGLRPAIVHTRNLAALEMQLVGAILPGVRRVHGEHGRDIYDLDGKNPKYRLLRKLLAPLIHRFITVSDDLRDWLVDDLRIRSSKVVRIYNGVDQARFTPRDASWAPPFPSGFLPEGGMVIGTVGRMAEVKNQRMLLQAFHALLEACPDFRSTLRLIMVGDGPLYNALDAEMRELGLDDVVWLPGDRSDVPELLAAMDIFVLPSLAEGISNTILEAMATGLPVVATNTGGNPELVHEGENGYLVPVGDSKALAVALQEMLGAPQQTKALGEAGRAIVNRHFNWDRTVASYLSIYDEVLSAK